MLPASRTLPDAGERADLAGCSAFAVELAVDLAAAALGELDGQCLVLVERGQVGLAPPIDRGARCGRGQGRADWWGLAVDRDEHDRRARGGLRGETGDGRATAPDHDRFVGIARDQI